MNSQQKYESPVIELIGISDDDIITTSPFNKDPDQNQGEWDKNEGDDGLWS